MDKRVVSWASALDAYSWDVNLTRFSEAKEYPGYFNRIVHSSDIVDFENRFRVNIKSNSTQNNYIIAGEVCYWKNAKSHFNCDTLTLNLLNYLSVPDNWESFRQAIFAADNEPSIDNYIRLINACQQENGFAIPITFLSFYNPQRYPMADKWIAYWWNDQKASHGYAKCPLFSQGPDGVILANTQKMKKRNWAAYLGWTIFSNQTAKKLSAISGVHWRPRDVEMATWEAEKRKIYLNPL